MSRFRIAEPAVALTDLAIAVETALFARTLAHQRTGPAALRRWFAIFFAGTSLASLAGAAYHALPSPGGTMRGRLWRVSLSGVVTSSLSAWQVGAQLGRSNGAPSASLSAVTVAHLTALAALTRTSPPYRMVIAGYLPAVASLAGSFSGRLNRPGDRVPAALGLAGLGLTMIAAWVQIRRIALHPRHFDHNAVYHLVQAAAFAVLNSSAQRFCSDEPGVSPSAGAIVGSGGMTRG